MRYFDLHCDTLYRAIVDDSDFNNNDYHVSTEKMKCFSEYKQIFAIWIPDEITKCDATSFFKKALNKYRNCITGNHYIAVENASMLNGDIDNISLLLDNCVKYVTLTWNGDNELGSGVLGRGNYGLTRFGKSVVRALESNRISVDVSHSSDKLFYDVIKMAKKPVIASHSNSRFITDNMRNLTDEQFKIIRDMGGIVGLNFYKGFLNNNEEKACIEDILRHAYHFLNLNGENTLAVGADFDGADMPCDIKGLESVPLIYQRFCDEFGAKLTKKVFFDNANMYFTNFDNI